MEHEIEIVEQTAQPVLAMRFRSTVEELPAQLGRVYASIIKYMEGLEEVAPLLPYAAYYNLDMNDLDIEAGFTITKAAPGEGEIDAGKIPSGKQVTCIHKGPYAAAETTYNKMSEWMKNNNCIPTGVAYEFYLNSPDEVPENELITKIVFPLQ